MNAHTHTTYILQLTLGFPVHLSIYPSTLLLMCLKVSCWYQYSWSLNIQAHFSCISSFSCLLKISKVAQKWVQGIANHPSGPAAVTSMDNLESILPTPSLGGFPSDSRHFLSIYSLLTVCNSYLKPSVLQVTSAFTVKTFPSVDITFWHISPDGIMMVGHTGVL